MCFVHSFFSLIFFFCLQIGNVEACQISASLTPGLKVQQEISIQRKGKPNFEEIKSFVDNETFISELEFVESTPNFYKSEIEDWIFKSSLQQLAHYRVINEEEIINIDTSLICSQSVYYQQVNFLFEGPIFVKVTDEYSRCLDWKCDAIITDDLDWDFYVSDALYDSLFQPLQCMLSQSLREGAVFTVEKDFSLAFDVLDKDNENRLFWRYHITKITEDEVFFSVDRFYLGGADNHQLRPNVIYQGQGRFNRHNPLMYHFSSHEEFPTKDSSCDIKISSKSI